MANSIAWEKDMERALERAQETKPADPAVFS